MNCKWYPIKTCTNATWSAYIWMCSSEIRNYTLFFDIEKWSIRDRKWILFNVNSYETEENRTKSNQNIEKKGNSWILIGSWNEWQNTKTRFLNWKATGQSLVNDLQSFVVLILFQFSKIRAAPGESQDVMDEVQILNLHWFEWDESNLMNLFANYESFCRKNFSIFYWCSKWLHRSGNSSL